MTLALIETWVGQPLPESYRAFLEKLAEMRF